MLQKKLRSMLKWMLLLFLMPVSLSACSAPEQPDPQPGTEAPTETPPPQDAAWSDYMITYTETEWPASQMRRSLFAACGKEIIARMEKRFETAPAGYAEVSKLENPDVPQLHFSFDANLPEQAYHIVITNDPHPAITLTAGSKRALFGAVTYFMEECLPWDGSLPAPTDYSASIPLIADPCVLLADGTYYMPFGTGSGYAIVKSDDLYNWSEPQVIFDANTCTNPAFDGFDNYWAPELHAYQGKFYLFATYKSAATGHRGAAIFRSDTPDGTYELISNGHLQPEGWDAIDPTLYIDEQGDPWMVFVHEWTSMPDGVGDMTAVRLTEDLTAVTGEFYPLFKANETPYYPSNNVTDGPVLHQMPDGRLAMVWSGSSNGYFTYAAYSENGVLGPWVQAEEPLFARDTADCPETMFRNGGGHAMLFTDKNGDLRMSLHVMFTASYEGRMPFFLHIYDSDGHLKIK